MMQPNGVRIETIRKLPVPQSTPDPISKSAQSQKAGTPLPHPSPAQPGDSLVQMAGKYLGTPYGWGGRLTKKNPQMDCLGLLFRSIQRMYGIPWQRWSTTPSELINQLTPDGSPGQTICVKDSIALASLKNGDFLFFLGTDPLADLPVSVDAAGNLLYVWHTGIYAGNGTVISAWPNQNTLGTDSGCVMRDNLKAFMEAGYASAVVVEPYGVLDSLAAHYKNNPVK
jgi:cell wall-associated NlpC family hydrolase